ncbi:MAG: M13 family metallopeptidase [Clostridia bacterium]|nr:M13 family metallopeptidase [Clostridia bacterium]
MHKKMMAILLALMMTVSFSSCSMEEPVMPEEHTTSDTLQKPAVGDNYYGYVNYEYLINGQIPYDRSSFGTFDNIEDEMEKDLSVLIDHCSEKEASKDTFELMIREIYRQYLDTDAREKAGVDALMPIVGMIEKCSTTEELVSALGVMYLEYGTSSFFKFDVAPDSYDTSINRLVLRNMNTCGNMKENFTKTDNGAENIGSMTKNTLTALEVDADSANERAKNVVSMINEIMVATLDSEYLNNIEKHYHLYTKKDFAGLFSNINTDNLLQAFDFKTEKLIIFDVSQSEKINEYFTEDHLRELKDYALTCLMFDYSSALPPSYSDKFTSQTSLKKDADKSAKYFVSDTLEEELGILYGREVCTEEVMTAANKMLKDLKDSCRQLIQNSERLSDDSKKKFIAKLDNIIFLLGYNRDYRSPFEITPVKDGGNLLENVIAIHRGKTLSEKEKLSQKADRNTWDMTPITVNAVYNPSVNTVTIPAVMLSQASFDPSYGEYKNLGMLGYVIAHEMNHAFDSNGYLFDQNGSYDPEWMDKEDQAVYQQLMDKAGNYYSHYKLLDIYNINGKQTLSENIADLAAVQCIANITDDKKELEQIFEGVAQQWATLNVITDIVQQLCADEHSPAEARVNAVLSSTDQFYEVYDIKETDKMYTAPENRIKVW